jgi:hypothetical protein
VHCDVIWDKPSFCLCTTKTPEDRNLQAPLRGSKRGTLQSRKGKKRGKLVYSTYLFTEDLFRKHI